MKEHILHASFLAYDTAGELPAPDRALLEQARAALEHSYSPYSHFKVGVAIWMANGEIMRGSNYENAAYPLCICAEQAVLAAAASRFPGIAVQALAVVIKGQHRVIDIPAAPCGGCRQVICETERKNNCPIRIVLQGETGPVYVFEKGGDLLPLAFEGSYL
ncbi:MAG: cytidine deaminase [Saprospirales bacterium]|jgi:cytidine deaminase|nr:cytidine deaminase [Saprospirales bacterium]